MKNYINLIVNGHRGHIISFIILNITLVLAETISIALIPLFLDFTISAKPILPDYFKIFDNFLTTKSKVDLINI